MDERIRLAIFSLICISIISSITFFTLAQYFPDYLPNEPDLFELGQSTVSCDVITDCNTNAICYEEICFSNDMIRLYNQLPNDQTRAQAIVDIKKVVKQKEQALCEEIPTGQTQCIDEFEIKFLDVFSYTLFRFERKYQSNQCDYQWRIDQFCGPNAGCSNINGCCSAEEGGVELVEASCITEQFINYTLLNHCTNEQFQKTVECPSRSRCTTVFDTGDVACLDTCNETRTITTPNLVKNSHDVAQGEDLIEMFNVDYCNEEGIYLSGYCLDEDCANKCRPGNVIQECAQIGQSFFLKSFRCEETGQLYLPNPMDSEYCTSGKCDPINGCID